MTTVYRAYSPTRDAASRTTTSRLDAEGMVGAANQGAVAFGKPADWRLQSTDTDWTNEDTP